MSVNKYLPHVLVLPEDDANSQLANGFVLEVAQPRNIQILPAAGGWSSVCEKLAADHVTGLRAFPDRHLVLLLDFDRQSDRAAKVEACIPVDLRDRVFLLGVLSEPEALKRDCARRSLDDIGQTLGQECASRSWNLWNHALLRHNTVERDRLDRALRGILF